jgi:hypothetical protein
MDDVLASIRRIVRTEKRVEDAEVVVPIDERRGDGPGWEGEGEDTLLLTPEMRTDSGAHEPAAGAGARPTELAADMSEASAGEPAPLPDREALRAMLREVLREEMDGGLAEGLVREIIRDELVHGEIGGNISQNVLRLIRDEVAKAVGTR